MPARTASPLALASLGREAERCGGGPHQEARCQERAADMWAPCPRVGTLGEGGDDHRQRGRATPWSRHERQPAPGAARGGPSSGPDAHAARPAATWEGRRRCGRAGRSGGAGAFSSAAPAGQSGGPPLGPLAAAVGPSWRPRARPPAHGRARRGAGPTPRVQPGLAPMRADEPTGRAWLLA